MRAMILAAGRGERMRPLTDRHPKPLLQAGGRPLLAWHLERLAAAGFGEVVINLAWLGEQIRATIGDGSRWGLHVTYSDEGRNALETAGGIRRALPLLGCREPFLVVNGDVWCDYPLARAVLPPGRLAHLVLVPNPAHNPGGDFALAGDEARPRGVPAYTFSGIGVYRASLFDGLGEGAQPLAPLLACAAEQRRVSAELWRGQWFDVGTSRRLEELDAFLAPSRNQPGQG
ncbi:MAG TPA: nucleotidyltransferase family protein [Gammaproteobacteria bacterium]|nr:nucleotidyltransferase family protein [Gammaproteobacteria bacterium]